MRKLQPILFPIRYESMLVDALKAGEIKQAYTLPRATTNEANVSKINGWMCEKCNETGYLEVETQLTRVVKREEDGKMIENQETKQQRVFSTTLGSLEVAALKSLLSENG